MSDFEQIINTRRSIREYAKKDVSDEDILKIIRAGMQAPGSRLGAEPWEFVVVKNKETLAKLGEIKPRVTNAPVAITAPNNKPIINTNNFSLNISFISYLQSFI